MIVEIIEMVFEGVFIVSLSASVFGVAFFAGYKSFQMFWKQKRYGSGFL